MDRGSAEFTLEVLQHDRQHVHVPISTVVIAGWTGRDPVAVEQHIAELETLGVKRPASVPTFYPVTCARLTSASSIQALGEDSSGEVEFVLLQHQQQLWVSVGSDHTDRRVETYDVNVSKQMCDKPVAQTWWALDDVRAHWDHLVLRSYIGAGAERTLYQQGPVSSMLEPAELIARYREAGGVLTEGTVMFCGTLAARGGVRPSPHFQFEIDDQKLGRKIQHEYSVSCLSLSK
jgi:uncharacterized protein DUF2848